MESSKLKPDFTLKPPIGENWSRLTSEPFNIFFRCVEDCYDAIMITDTVGRLVYVNPAWVRIYGYSFEEAVGQTPRILRSSEQESGFYTEMWKKILDPSTGHWRGEIVNKTKEGLMVPVLLTITPFRGETGEIKGYMGIALDISLQRDLEARVVQQDRLASIGLLASGLAHEIGTPLGVIRGRAEFLQMGADCPSHVSKGLGVIISQIDRISKLINSLLHLARKSPQLPLRPVYLKDVLEEVVNLVEQKLERSQTKLQLEFSNDFQILAEPSQFQQVFLNLIINSIHAISTAQKLGRTADHHILISAKNTPQSSRIRVSDTGCGISKQNLKKLFQPFFTTKDVGEGTGMGLAVVAKIISEHNGTIAVESEVGVGTNFTISLPPLKS